MSAWWGGKDYDGVHDVKAASPEERLWMAVIETAVWDYRTVLRQVQRELKRSGGTFSWQLWREFERLKHEFSTPWFWEICEYAGVHQSRLIGLMAREAKEAGLDLTRAVYNPYYGGVNPRRHGH